MWQSIIKAFGTKLHFASTLHPQTDGQSEAVVKIVSQMLRAYVNEFHEQWLHYLPVLQLAYNNSMNESTKNTPFYINNGFHASVPSSFINRSQQERELHENYMNNLQRVRRLVERQLVKAQQKQAKYYNKGRKNIEYNVEIGRAHV